MSDFRMETSTPRWKYAPVTALKGISEGGKRRQQLRRLGIETVLDLALLFPRTYQDRGDVRQVSDESDGDPHSYILTVVTSPTTYTPRRGMTITRFRAADDSGVCEIVFFNQTYIRNMFPIGARFRFFGRMTCEKNSRRMSAPSYEPISGVELPRYLPIYPTTEGLSQKMISQFVADAVERVLPELRDSLPEEIRQRRSLSTLRYAIEKIHFPQSRDELERARHRLSYDEFFLFALRMRISRKRRASESAPQFRPVDMKPYTDSLPYALTGAQSRAIGDIERDLCGSRSSGVRIGTTIPMARIVIGDVGCGKTAIAAAAAYIAAKNGFQTVLMAPTEILARQHYDELSGTLSRLGFNVTLLCGSQTANERRLALAECVGEGAPRADLIIGTHALIEDEVKFYNPGLVITDEQHRFGALQRAALSKKSAVMTPHSLVMSATPIPRTLSLVMYGDLDVSVIDEMPPGRQIVDTFVVNEKYRTRLNAFIRAQVAARHQVYVVCPSVEETDFESGDAPLKSAVSHAEYLAKELPDIAVGVVHGKMKGSDKEHVMAGFAAGKIQVLVSTTVIEVGVNVPNATLMIVENAERFGLSQLHQLRGRVGRGSAKSYCVLVSNAQSGSVAYERLMTMKREHDGFRIAERDLALRGPGDFLPQNGEIRQSGSFGFRLANVDGDSDHDGENDGMERLKEAFEDAGALLDSDPELSSHEGLLRILQTSSTDADATIS